MFKTFRCVRFGHLNIRHLNLIRHSSFEFRHYFYKGITVHRIWAMMERDLRRFRRSPTLVMISMVLPLVQLVILGYAFGGTIQNLQVGVVDRDHGMEAVKLQEMFTAVQSNAKTFHAVSYADEAEAMRDLREGRISAVVNIPPEYSRKVLAGASPNFALIVDNTDQFASAALEAEFGLMLAPLNAGGVEHGLAPQVTVSIVEVYPYVPYIQFLLAGSIVLAIFVSAMIGGGIIYIDDKARGLHEGYLVTPITKFELIMGFNLAGAMKAIISGFVLVTVGSVIAGIPDPLNVVRLAKMLMLVVVTALALISMMFLLMVRVSDPLVPRAIFGVLNTILFFPSGAVYPTAAFPRWMQWVSIADPFTYAVHGFKELLLKNTGVAAISFDLLYLIIFTAIVMAAATLLFKRAL